MSLLPDQSAPVTRQNAAGSAHGAEQSRLPLLFPLEDGAADQSHLGLMAPFEDGAADQSHLGLMAPFEG